MDQESATEVPAHLLKKTDVDVLSIVFVNCHAWKRTLHRINQRNIFELLPHSNPRRSLFRFLNTKLRFFEFEDLTYLGKQKRENTAFFGRLWIVAPIHKNVRFSRMPVEIAEHHKLTFLMHVLNQLLAVVDRRLKCFRWKFPAPVEVATSQWTSVIAVDNTVRVKHRYNLEYEVLTEKACLHVVWIGQEE